MILSVLLSALSFYPWNVGVTVFGTAGNYSTGEEYLSKAIYFSMDRRSKDGFVVGYEDVSISGDLGTYRQYNLLARDIFWIKTELRVGGVVGHFHTNGSDDGWLLGGQVMGDFPWFGYAGAYTRSDYRNWALLDSPQYTIDQLDLSLSRGMGNHIFRVGFSLQEDNLHTYQTTIGTWTWLMSKEITISVNIARGESIYYIDPYLIILNNIPDILKSSISGRIVFRLSANWHVTGVVTSHDYKNYSINYLAIGIQARF